MKKKRKRPPPVPGRKPGRPQGSMVPREMLKVRRAVRYTDDEWDQIVTAGQLDGLTASDLIRKASIKEAQRIMRRQKRSDSHGTKE